MDNQRIKILTVTMASRQAHSRDNSVVTKNIDVVPPFEYSLHSHPYYKLFFVLDSDDFSIQLNNCLVGVAKNRIYLSPPYTLHTPLNYYDGAITAIDVKFLVCDEEFASRIGTQPRIMACNDEIRSLMSEVFEEYKQNSISGDRISSILCYILETISDSPQDDLIGSNNAERDRLFPGLAEYINENYAKSLTLSQLAAIVHIEKTHFAKKFKAVYGITPVNYLYSVRLSRSLDELMFTDTSVAKIAKSVGFENVASYCTAFRRAYGLSPSEYRKKTSSPPL